MDINAAMLTTGRDRLLDQGLAGNLLFCQVNAETQPFPDNHFDCVTIGFGLRNVTHKQKALAEMCRVLKPGGRSWSWSASMVPRWGRWSGSRPGVSA